MKKIFLLIAFASTTSSAVAMADDDSGPSIYDINVSGSCAGKAKFTSAPLPANYSGIYGGDSVCGYTMDWTNPIIDAATVSTSCNVTQFINYSQSKCGDFGKSLQTPNSIAPPFLNVSECQGFDPAGTVQTVNFMLSTEGHSCGMKGLATYSFYPYMIQPIAFSCLAKDGGDPLL